MNLSTRKITALAVAAAAVIALIWYAAVFRPQSSQLAATNSAYANTRVEIGQLRTQASALEALERQVPADKARLAALEQSLPTTPDLRGVLDQLHQLATSSGCQLTTVSPQVTPAASPTSSGSAAVTATRSVSLAMTATGTYSQLMGLLSGLSTMPRTVVVDSVAINPGANGLLNVTLASRIFYS